MTTRLLLATNRTILLPLGNQHWSVSTAIHVQPSTSRLMRSCLATIDAKSHGSITITSNSVSCVFIVFAIYPKLLNPSFTLLPIFHRNISHPFTLKPFHHGPYQDLVYHQDSFEESYRNDASYRNARRSCSCSCRCCYRRTYHRDDDRSCSCRCYYRTYD